MSTLHAANSFFEFSRPWELKLSTITNPPKRHVPLPNCDQNALRLETIIAMTMDTLRLCGIVLQPLLPQLSSKLLDKLSVPWNQRMWRNLKDHFGLIIDDNCEPPMEASLSRADAVLFPRICPKEDDDDRKPAKAQKKKSKKSKTAEVQPATSSQNSKQVVQ